MDKNIAKGNEKKIKTLIKNLKKRNMTGYYCETKEDACEQVLSLIRESDVVSWGGSVTLNELNIKDKLTNVIDAMSKTDPDEAYAERVKALSSDVYLTSTNAITMEGELVNIDGTGNRVAAICFGPKKVIIIAGVNKITSDEETALKRIKLDACVPNCIRLGKKTPCVETGQCSQCMSPGNTVCSMTVTTRFCSKADRIHIVLVNDTLGY